MADEQESIAPDELDTPAIEEEQDPTTNDNLTEEDLSPEESQPEGEEQEAPVEYAEIERNGKRYQVPKELESEFMMQGDYTKKTQEVAEKRRELEAFEERVKQQAQVSEEELHERATLVNVTSQLQQYQTVDWDALQDEDPMAAQKHWRTFQTLEKQYAQLSGNLQQRHETRTREAQQETAKRIEETRAFAQKSIPGWSEKLDADILNFALEQGVDKAALQQAINPQVYKIMHLAYVGSKALNKTATAPKPQTTAAAPKPLATVAARGGAVSKDIAEMSMDEYAAHRRRQMANKR